MLLGQFFQVIMQRPQLLGVEIPSSGEAYCILTAPSGITARGAVSTQEPGYDANTFNAMLMWRPWRRLHWDATDRQNQWRLVPSGQWLLPRLRPQHIATVKVSWAGFDGSGRLIEVSSGRRDFCRRPSN